MHRSDTLHRIDRAAEAAAIRDIREQPATPPPPADYAWAAYLHALERARQGAPPPLRASDPDERAQRFSVRLGVLLALLTPVVLFVVLVLP